MNLEGPALLDAIRYLPAIRSRQAELRGYAQLRQETKDSLHPLVSLGKLGRVDDANRVIETVRERIGPCFLDLNILPGQACSQWNALCDPTENYRAWRDLAANNEGVIPVALLRDGATERPFIRQALLIEEAFGAVVIRSRRPAQDLTALQAALSAVHDVNNVLIVLDLGYVRGAIEPKETEARRVISALRITDPAARIAVLASSYPRAVSAYGDQRGFLQIVERDLHAQIGGDEGSIYGDHASIYPEPFEPSISRWVPRIDYCLDYAWRYERRREDDGGYVRCAAEIVNSPDWEPAFADRSWGADVIRRTNINGVVEPGFGAPGNWIAARVNMHIERQTALGLAGAVDFVGGDDDWEGEF
ncbi:beta family protein [Shinella sp. SUS2]|uniref:beta family protein n=1 Tax=Shinella sp. SUS2 TaxID=1692241 RepID=UPI0009E897D8|nr:beta family protein [Shinella sp. SUS2]